MEPEASIGALLEHHNIDRDHALTGEHIPRGRSPLHCCCNKEDCLHLRAGKATIGDLERDVKTAARVGQALLIRHEAYVADAESELKSKQDFIMKLEEESRNVEEHNKQISRENRSLNDQIEGLNTAIGDSESRVKSLTATLQSAQQEISRLSLLSARTEQLEIRLQEVEAEQETLQNTLTITVEGKRAAEKRWRASQKKVNDLLSQMDAIESEAYEERSRHEEVVLRMQKSSAVEKELRESESHARGKSEVVSSFVKEILQDNANLQLGMMELRELLANSNEELESLRSQALFDDQSPSQWEPLSHDLKNGLDTSSPQQLSREVHVHHHYHSSPATQNQSRQRQPPLSRPKRKRYVLHGKSTNQSQSSLQTVHNNNAHEPLETTSGIGPEHTAPVNGIPLYDRISAAPSTVPSSPMSTIFDRTHVEEGMEFSRPTSPESNGVWSPFTGPRHMKDGSMDSVFQPMSLPSRLSSGSMLNGRKQSTLEPISNLEEDIGEPGDIEQNGQDQVYEEDVPDESAFKPTNAPKSPTTGKTRAQKGPPTTPSKPVLKRTTSHASLISISGMDIHSTFESPFRAGMPRRPPLRASATGASATVVTATHAQAFAGRSRGRSTVLTEGLRGNLKTDLASSKAKKDRYNPLFDTFGRRVGGWIVTKWNGAQAAEEPRERSPVKVTSAVDEDALKESLLEDIEGELAAEAGDG